MSLFRIYIYLKIKYFFFSFFKKKKDYNLQIQKKINFYTRKKFTILTGQLRVGFYLVLDFLKIKYPKKNEIIINSYNLADMVNICKNMNLKIVFPKLNNNIFICSKDLKKKITKKTLAVVVTNIFNSSSDILEIKRICKSKKIILIEDNAIYFGNYTRIRNKKVYSGSFGDYSLHSFNIMKNISGMFGGSVSTNDSTFNKYSVSKLNEFNKFPKLKYIKQCIIYILLKFLSINAIYKYFFIHILNWTYRTRNKFLLYMIYPSLRFKKGKHQPNFLSKISSFSEKVIVFQLNDTDRIKYFHEIRKKNNIYYQNLLEKIKNKNLELIKIKEKNFQNFNEYPIILKNQKYKSELANYLLSKGIETKVVQYVDCDKIFRKKEKKIINNYQNRIICLPNHPKIKKNYIKQIIFHIDNFLNYSNETI